MKRIKFFFGTACLLVAVGSAYATSVLGDAPADYKLYVLSGTTHCVPIPVTTCTQPVTPQPCVYPETPSIAYPVYDYAALISGSLVCSQRLYFPQ